MGSTRLPGKVLLALGERHVLEHVVGRAVATRADDVVVTTATTDANDAIAEWSRRHDRRCFRGPEEDLLGRHRDVAESTDSSTLVRITGDCPFVPPSEIERLLAVFEDSTKRYVTNVTDTMPVGTGVDILDVSLLDELVALGDDHPVLRLRREPDEWGTVSSSHLTWEQYGDAHIAVDTPADYWALTDAVAAVGNDPKRVAEWITVNRSGRDGDDTH